MIPLHAEVFHKHHKGNYPPFTSEIEKAVCRAVCHVLNKGYTGEPAVTQDAIEYIQTTTGAEILIRLSPRKGVFIDVDKARARINAIFARKKFVRAHVFNMDNKLYLSLTTDR